jgi:hypothetical protein
LQRIPNDSEDKKPNLLDNMITIGAFEFWIQW